MPKFKIKTPDGTFVVTAPDEQSAINALRAQPASDAAASFRDFASSASKDVGGAVRAETRRKDQAEYESMPGWAKPLVAGYDVANLVANGATFGFGDKAIAGVGSILGGDSYDEELAKKRRDTQASRNRSGLAGGVAELAGGVKTGLAAGRAGLTLMGPGQSVPRLMAGGAIEGAGYGTLSALGNDTDVATSAITGGVIGGLAPGVIEVLRRGFAPLFARLRPEAATDRAIRTMVERSGRTPQQIVDDLNAAVRDGQGEYMVADALGNPGQRTLSTIARTPSEARTGVVEALERRQAGQGGRVAGFLDDAFGAPVTAAQTEAGRIALRRSGANTNFGAARAQAGPVDVSKAIAEINNVVSPGITQQIGAGANNNSVYSAMSRMRSLLGTNGSRVTDFNRAHLAKIEMDNLIDQGGTIAALLRPARNALDDALSAASQPYAAARDSYRGASQGIEAIDVGRTSAQRGRIEDTIPRFQGMSPVEQSGFRAGYVDPLIERVQRAAPGANKARPLVTDKMRAELPAFAQQGRAPRLDRQINREMQMFDTRGQALGGSRTADNLSDAADNLGTFDVSFWGNLLTGNVSGAAGSAGRQMLANLHGLPPRVREQLAGFLLERNSGVAMQRIARAVAQGQRLTARDLATIRVLTGAGVSTATQTQRRGQ